MSMIATNGFASDINGVVKAHDNFSLKKSLPLNPDMCVVLTVNPRPRTRVPVMKIDDILMKEVRETKILGVKIPLSLIIE